VSASALQTACRRLPRLTQTGAFVARLPRLPCKAQAPQAALPWLAEPSGSQFSRAECQSTWRSWLPERSSVTGVKRQGISDAWEDEGYSQKSGQEAPALSGWEECAAA